MSRGQTALEYAVLVAAVSAAMVTMTLYIRRAAQSHVALLDKQISTEAMR
jgi:hypothetical protein